MVTQKKQFLRGVVNILFENVPHFDLVTILFLKIEDVVISRGSSYLAARFPEIIFYSRQNFRHASLEKYIFY